MISSSGNSSNAVSYTSLQNSINTLSAQKMFRKLSGNSGTAKTSDAEIGIRHSDSDSDTDVNKSADNKLTEKKLESNVDYIGAKSKSDKDRAVPQIKYGHHKKEEEFFYDGKAMPPLSSFDSLAAEIGAIGDKISKQQLMAYLNSLTADGKSVNNNSTQIAFVKNIIAKFDTLSNGGDYITSLTGIKEPQDYKTVTPEQVTPPFEVRV